MTDALPSRRVVPAWSYRPGPDVSDFPPSGLVKVQAIAKGAAAAGVAAAAKGVSEIDVDLAVSDHLRTHAVEHVWTITNVGMGENTHVCFPTRGPTQLQAKTRDVVMVDVHPISVEGFWGDCTRCGIIGAYPEARTALSDLERLHYEVLAKCRPGMRASDLFGMCHERLVAEGFVLLDELGNIGHSLSPGAAYLQEFIDSGNDSAMWGAWAIEPFAARGDIAVKVEDLVWFGRDICTVL
jgi:Xaa-Pro dipeptidase